MMIGTKKVNYDIYTFVERAKREPATIAPQINEALNQIVERGLPPAMTSAECNSYWDMTIEIIRMESVGDDRAEIVKDNRHKVLADALKRGI